MQIINIEKACIAMCLVKEIFKFSIYLNLNFEFHDNTQIGSLFKSRNDGHIYSENHIFTEWYFMNCYESENPLAKIVIMKHQRGDMGILVEEKPNGKTTIKTMDGQLFTASKDQFIILKLQGGMLAKPAKNTTNE